MPLTEEQRALVVANLGLVAHTDWILRDNGLARRLDVEDRRSAGYVGLCNAATTYDPARGFKFTTYACRAIKNAIMSAALSGGVITLPHNFTCRELTQEIERKIRAAWTVGGLPDFAGEATPGREENGEEEGVGDQQRENLARAMRFLQAGDREILEMVYTQGLTFVEVGKRLGVSKSRIGQRRARAILKLKRLLGVEG